MDSQDMEESMEKEENAGQNPQNSERQIPVVVTETMDEEKWQRKAFKNSAKTLLRGRWKVPVLACLLTTLICGILLVGFYPWQALVAAFNGGTDYMSEQAAFSFAMQNMGKTMLYALVYSVSIPAFLLSFFILLQKMHRDKESVSLVSFVNGFSFWYKGILGMLWQSLWIYLWSLLIVLVTVVVIVLPVVIFAVAGVMQEDSLQVFGFAFGVVLFVVAYVLLLSKYYSYSMQPYAISDVPTMGVRKALTLSKKITKGYKVKLFVLDLSFIGWYLLCMLSLGIGFLWLAPYYGMTKINAYHFLKKTAISNGVVEESDFAGQTPQKEPEKIEEDTGSVCSEEN